MTIVLVFLAALFLFVLADYFRLFGSSEKTFIDMTELNFRTIDAKSGALVTEVHIRCFQKRNQNACAEKESPGIGLITAVIPIKIVKDRSFLFDHQTKIQGTADPKLHIMFIHNDYNNPVKTLMVNDIPSLAGQTITIEFNRDLQK